jgi:DNA-binding MarR family transcriptional regulator
MTMSEQQGDPDAARVSALAADLRGLVGKLKRRFREQVHLGELTWSQVSVLAHLDRGGPATLTALARAEGVRPQSMGATVSALEAAGLVIGEPDSHDGRQTILSLTAASRDLIRAGRAAGEDWLFRTIQAHLTPPEQEELARALALLQRLVDSPR